MASPTKSRVMTPERITSEPGRTRVLRELVDAGELARPELIQRTGLSPATVTSVIEDLIGENLVRRSVAESSESRLGRPPLTFGLRPEHAIFFSGRPRLSTRA